MKWMTKTISMTRSNAVLITAAGSSQRFGEKKEFLPLYANTHTSVLSACLYAFVSTGLFSRYVITVPQGKILAAYTLLTADTQLVTFLNTHSDSFQIIEGGASRQESVYKGLLTLADKTIRSILIHDGARPWVSCEVITAVLAAVEKYGAAVPAIAVTDTQKEVDETGKIIRHLRRDRLAAVQTPQGFRFEPLLSAHRQASNDGAPYTDDSEIYARYCAPVYICPGSRENKKITYREDL